MQNYILLSLGALSISFAPILVKLSQLSAADIGFYRCFLGGGALFLYSAIRHGRSPRFLYTQIPLIFLGGLFFSIDLFSWHLAIRYSGAGLATVLANTQVFFAAIISHFLFHERLPKSFFAWATLAILGLSLLCIPPNFELPTNYLLGVALALLAGCLYAAFLSCLKIWQKKYTQDPSYYPILWISLSTSLFFFSFSGFDIENADASNWKWMLLLGLGVHACGWFLINHVMGHIPLRKLSLVLLIQPLLASLLAIYFFNEFLNLRQFVGMFLCLFAVYKGQSAQ